MSTEKKTPLEEANRKRLFWKIVAGIGSVALIVVSVATGGKIKLTKRG